MLAFNLRRLIVLLLLTGYSSVLHAQSADQLYAGGRQAFTDGLWPAATSQFSRLLREYPEDPRADSAAYMGAVAYYNAGDFRRSTEILQAFPRRYPDSAWNRRVAYWEGLALFELKDWTGAATAFQKQSLLTSEPAYRERSLLYLGACRENLGDWRSAERVYQTIVDSGRDYEMVSRAIFRIGQIRLSDNRPSEALESFTRLAWDYPASPVSGDIEYWIAESRRRMGQNEAALASYRNFLATVYQSPYRTFALLEAARLASLEQSDDEALAYLDLRDTEMGRNTDESAGTALRIRAASYLRTGQILKARAAYSAILANPADSAEEQTASFDLAQTWLGTRDVLPAVPFLQRASNGPNPAIAADALYLAGSILLHSGDVGGADLLENFARRFPAEGRREEALRLAARARRDAGDGGRATADLTLLIRDYPGSSSAPSYLFLRAEIALDSGDSTSALRDYGIIIESHAKSDLAVEAHSRIGFIYTRRDEHVRAAGHYLKAAEISGGASGGEAGRRAVYSAGVAYFNGGRSGDAIKQFSLLVVPDASGPWGVEAAYHLGEAFYDRSEFVSARQAYETAARFGKPAMVFEALYGIGWTWFRESKWSEAANAFLRAAEATKVPEEKARSLYRSGLSRASATEWDAALALYEQALSNRTGAWREEALYQKAWALMNIGRMDEADRTADSLASEFPASKLPPDLPFRMGETAMAAGVYREALVWYDRCVQRYPDSDMAVRAGLRAALAARESGATGESAERYVQWIVLHPADPGAGSAARSLSEALKAYGDPDLALSSLNRIREVAPNRKELTTPIVIAWARVAGIPQEALETLEEIAEDEKMSPADRAEALLLTAHRYRMDGRYSRSRQLYEVLIRDIPGRIGAEAQEGLARSFAQEGKIDEAAEAYLAVPYLYPDQTDLGIRSLREAESLYRQAGRDAEADKVRARISN